MAIGPGKYDTLATHAREDAEADAVILVVFNGNKGSGFSVQVHAGNSLLFNLPDVLRKMAADIEATLTTQGGTS